MKEVIISPKAIEELDESITQVQDGLAIICNGNTHAAIENEHFAYVKNHPDLPDGLYQAKAAIAANEALSTSNLTADPSGGLNKLKEDVDALNSNIADLNANVLRKNPVDGAAQVSDLNDIAETSLYAYGGNTPNAPTTNGGVVLTIASIYASQRSQLAFPNNQSYIACRNFRGTWGAWSKISTTAI